MSAPVLPYRFFERQLQGLTGESRNVAMAEIGLSALGCTHIEQEYNIPGTPGGKGYRVDLKGVLPNGRWVLVEVKDFEDTATPYVDAVLQAASYADAIQHPVFIGPILGSRSTLGAGSVYAGLSMLHLLAGRLNVGFLCCSETGTFSLLLRGQNLARGDGSAPADGGSKWSYVQRLGSRVDRK